MIGRRPLLLGGLAGVAATSVPARAARAALPVPSDGRLAFVVMREGSQIGRHTLIFERAPGDDLLVRIDVDLKVSLGPLPLFRYTHRGNEHWRHGHLEVKQSKTDKNGTGLAMSARREGTALLVSGTAIKPYTAPPNAHLATHWNRAMLTGPLINTEDGKLVTPTTHAAGTETVLVAGRPVKAQRYEVRGEIEFDTWYDTTPSWVALRFKARDGSEVRYQRV